METKKLPTHYAAVLASRRETLREQFAPILGTASRSIVWEVGCGHGHFLTAYAAAHPETICIGVDIESDRIARALKKRDRARLPHLHFIRSEARLFLNSLPSETRIAKIFILFPDPWPKSRHHKHRILGPEFLHQLALHSEPSAQLYFRTDHQDYFAQAEAIVRGSTAWEILPVNWPFEFETVFQSRAVQHSSLIAGKRTG